MAATYLWLRESHGRASRRARSERLGHLPRRGTRSLAVLQANSHSWEQLDLRRDMRVHAWESLPGVMGYGQIVSHKVVS